MKQQLTTIIKSLLSKKHLESITRSALKTVGGFCTAHGYATDTTWTKIAGDVMIGAGLLSSYIEAHETVNPVPVPAPVSAPTATPTQILKSN